MPRAFPNDFGHHTLSAAWEKQVKDFSTVSDMINTFKLEISNGGTNLDHALFLNASDAEQFNDLIGHVHRISQENNPEFYLELLGNSDFLASSTSSGSSLRRISSYNLIVVEREKSENHTWEVESRGLGKEDGQKEICRVCRKTRVRGTSESKPMSAEASWKEIKR